MLMRRLYRRMINSLGVEGIEIPATYIKFYKHDRSIPEQVSAFFTDEESVMCCQAARYAPLEQPVLLTIDNIGCVAAAISLGLVDQEKDTPLRGPRTYTNLMGAQTGSERKFDPPSPKDFTTGIVYACRSAGRKEFCFFGTEDSGRFRDVATARAAVSQMMAIQPPVMKGVFFYSNSFEEFDLTPDIVLLSVRPVELTKIIQGYQYITGKPVNAVMNALRVVDSDLIARPYLTQEINVSSYCLGARMVARFQGDRLGMGIPFNRFELIVKGMEESKSGYPFHKYPGARP
ncbi:MAG: DUF169 domain-containing protein [Deltaproteobacteria bacterium]|nr:DUF169 domain-containing protein [Deltaproteobacteria bacterium]